MIARFLLLFVFAGCLGGCASAPAFAVHSTFVSKPPSVVVATDPIPLSDKLTATGTASIDLDTLAPKFRLQIDVGTPEAALACSIVRLSLPGESIDREPDQVPGTARIVFELQRAELEKIVSLNICGKTVDIASLKDIIGQFLHVIDSIRGALM